MKKLHERLITLAGVAISKRKSTLVIMSASIAAIITTSAFAFALPNQVFAQTGGHGGWLVGHSGLLSQTNVKVLGHVPHVGQILAGHLGDVCLSCWGQALAGQQGRHP